MQLIREKDEVKEKYDSLLEKNRLKEVGVLHRVNLQLEIASEL